MTGEERVRNRRQRRTVVTRRFGCFFFLRTDRLEAILNMQSWYSYNYMNNYNHYINYFIYYLLINYINYYIIITLFHLVY